MHWIVYHIASGHAFFSGLLFVCLAVVFSQADKTRWLAKISLLVGVISIGLTSTPLAYWFYVLGLSISAIWLIRPKRIAKSQTIGVLLIGWCILAFLFELPNQWLPFVTPTQDQRLVIIGDSVTAGMGGSDTTQKWPIILAEEYSIDIQDLSHPGATASSALKRVRSDPPIGELVVIEIGGNDVLGSTSSSQFQHDLTALFESLAVPGRQMVMLELPLIPFYHEYGRIQRHVANQFDVKLVPKAHFLAVLAEEKATVDSIHLTQHGHAMMAKMIWQVVKPAYR